MPLLPLLECRAVPNGLLLLPLPLCCHCRYCDVLSTACCNQPCTFMCCLCSPLSLQVRWNQPFSQVQPTTGTALRAHLLCLEQTRCCSMPFSSREFALQTTLHMCLLH